MSLRSAGIQSTVAGKAWGQWCEKTDHSASQQGSTETMRKLAWAMEAQDPPGPTDSLLPASFHLSGALQPSKMVPPAKQRAFNPVSVYILTTTLCPWPPQARGHFIMQTIPIPTSETPMIMNSSNRQCSGVQVSPETQGPLSTVSPCKIKNRREIYIQQTCNGREYTWGRGKERRDRTETEILQRKCCSFLSIIRGLLWEPSCFQSPGVARSPSWGPGSPYLGLAPL